MTAPDRTAGTLAAALDSIVCAPEHVVLPWERLIGHPSMTQFIGLFGRDHVRSALSMACERRDATPRPKQKPGAYTVSRQRGGEMSYPFLDHDPADGKEYGTQCARCGSSLAWEDCDNCGGLGGWEVDPEGDEWDDCYGCDGSGGWYVCASTDAFCQANPLPGRELIESDTPEFFVIPPRVDSPLGTSGGAPGAGEG